MAYDNSRLNSILVCTHLKFPRREIELEIASGKIKVHKRKDGTFLNVNNDIFSIM